MRIVLVAFGALVAALVLGAGALGAYAYYTFHARVEGQYFESKGTKIHYVVEGEGVPVVLVHGFAVNADLNWRRSGVLEALRRRYQVIAFDQRGHGLSGKPHDPERYGLEMARDVPRLLDHLGIEKAHVAGYSLGGFVTLKLAALYPERLLSAAPMGAGWESGEESPLLGRLDELAAKLEAGEGITPPGGQLGEGRPENPLFQKLAVKVATRFFNDGKALGAMLRGIPQLELSERELRAIEVPLLSVVGGEDPLKAGVESMRGKVADHEIVVVEGARHMDVVRGGALLEALKAFLREHSPELSLRKPSAEPARLAAGERR